ncbi:MAG: 4Fe-4S binding protein [Planctomycetes bacterium]|nr:4Fe-4S binding protein [Planctomycetota bacterium]
MAVEQRNIVAIDETKCDGCGICVQSCHEGAIQMVDGKARLVADAYCDGLGDCLAPCPTGAISIITRPAAAFDAEAVAARLAARGASDAPRPAAGCPGLMAQTLAAARPAAVPPPASGPQPCGCPGGGGCPSARGGGSEASACTGPCGGPVSQLVNWPVQLRLIPANAPYLEEAELLLTADCVPVASPVFHEEFCRRGPVALACPKLDDTAAQMDKIRTLVQTGRPAAVTVLRMEVPCCGGLVRAAEEALAGVDRPVPLAVTVISTDGTVLERKRIR